MNAAMRRLESEITNVRRYVLQNRSTPGSDDLWLQRVWIDLLLDRWSELGRRLGSEDDSEPVSPRKECGRSVRALPRAVEPLTLAGLGACLQGVRDLVVVADTGIGSPQVDVCVHATEQVDADFLNVLRASARRFAAPVVLVANQIEKADLEVLTRCRVISVLPRVAASRERLVDTVRAVGAHRQVPGPDLLAGLRELL
ncbi:hypothetical protein AB5J62_24160 [Amycolatopsis sp. cg5]|uniref:hypothetical protein n=1 Tax=Amycolatopsis sp. cg5 TaxID=3238802 RepID=UPI003526AB56